MRRRKKQTTLTKADRGALDEKRDLGRQRLGKMAVCVRRKACDSEKMVKPCFFHQKLGVDGRADLLHRRLKISNDRRYATTT